MRITTQLVFAVLPILLLTPSIDNKVKFALVVIGVVALIIDSLPLLKRIK